MCYVEMKNNNKRVHLIPSTQVPPFIHGFGSQSLILMLHVAPLKPVFVQSQLYELTPSVQIPPFKHGLGEQSSILFSHFVPLNPVKQLHVYANFFFFFFFKLIEK